MPRGPRSAGREIHRRVRNLDRRLLDLERRAFVDVDRRFAEVGEDAAKVARRAEEDGVQGNDAAVARLMELYEQALERAEGEVETLVVESIGLARGSIGDELTAAEDTLAARFAGVWQDAQRGLAEYADAVVEEAMRRFRRTEEQTLEGFHRELNRQIVLAVEHGDFVDRVVSVEPLNLEGNAGRGVWWRGASTLKTQARASSVQAVNGVRSAAIELFNEAANARR